MNEFEFKALKNKFPDCEITIRMNKYKMEQYGELEEELYIKYKDSEHWIDINDEFEWILKRARYLRALMIEEYNKIN